ncbi:MAG: alpha/beta hydrolase [Bacteroidales bacterium]|nr:alpha/beta hydrolase [Bacteroidales bacterium]
MKSIISPKALLPVLFSLVSLLAPVNTFAQERAELERFTGTWLGRLESGVMYLRIVFNISLNDKDTLKVSMESPDQGTMIIPLGNAVTRGDSLIIDARIIGGEYLGRLAGEKNMEGLWKQMGQTFTLNLEKQDAPFKQQARPQDPKTPLPYRSEEVTFRNENAGITLAGTLTLPQGDGPFPAAIMITGSGPQNRDEEIMGHKPFAVIADHLTRNGIAVLRYDDRGVGKSQGVYSKATSADLATDAEAALNFLQGHSSINKSMTGLIGHSEGGLIAPILAARDSRVAWIVSLAGPGVNGEQVLLKQSTDISLAMGSSEEEVKTSEKINRKLYKVIRKVPNSEDAGDKIVKIMTKELKKIDVEQEVINERINTLKLSLLGDPYNWFRYFIVTEPSSLWKEIKAPVLILNGEKDLQVNAGINTSGIAEALKSGGNTSYEVKIFPGLNHLFQHSETGLPQEYGTIEETFSPEVLSVISGWIRKLAY